MKFNYIVIFLLYCNDFFKENPIEFIFILNNYFIFFSCVFPHSPENNTSTSESESSSSDESFTMDESFSGAELDTTRQFTLRDQILKSKSGKTSKFVRVETRESKRKF